LEEVADAPEVRVDIEVEARSVIVPPPSTAVATWKKLLKDVPVDALPILEIVADRLTATFSVAVVGLELPAVRSGIGSGSATHALPLQEAPATQVAVATTPEPFGDSEVGTSDLSLLYK
jgi:hypothetical protein